MGNVYPAQIVRVNGTVPGAASSVTYDITVASPDGPLSLAGVAPGYRPAKVRDGTVHVDGFSQGDRVMVALLPSIGSVEALIITPEPLAMEACDL